MKPCTRVGIDVTWRCQQQCLHCFYRRNPNLHTAVDIPLAQITAKINQAQRGGCNHVVMVGHGEPSLCPNVDAVLQYCREHGMASSMITNGATALRKFQLFFEGGLDHLHLSSHGLGDTLDQLVGQPGAFRRQRELTDWCRAHGYPFRTNVTMQQVNYRQLPELAEYEVARGAYHCVLLGFLPHYEWRGHVQEIAVHPAELRPYLEGAADVFLANRTYFTIRYHPLCHLSPVYWPYVVNARYVNYDPWEWNYELQTTDPARLWRASVAMGDSVANTTRCRDCVLRRHCGGWNKTYADAFAGADLRPAKRDDVPDQFGKILDQDGGLHDLNPANQLTGTIQ